MITNCKNILVLAPHTDDGELGLGGTISRLIEDGKKVTYVAFSTAQQSVPEGFPKDILRKTLGNRLLCGGESHIGHFFPIFYQA